MFDSTKSFKQIEVNDGRAYGLHQTLDGRPWNSFDYIQTEYRQTDITRWAVDLDKTEDYGSRPLCDQSLVKPWTGVAFDIHDGSGTLTIDQVMTE